ncbi:glutathione S-transferase II [Chaetomium sp. MPI-CAGE-AT-0009]|nr:glutathione S-transferase II [Chaetomium sp. MPI-CAGE-AT-0009]
MYGAVAEAEGRLREIGTHAAAMLFIRQWPLAGSGIRSRTALGTVLTNSHRNRSFYTHTHHNLVPLTRTTTHLSSPSHLRPINPPQLRTIFSTAPKLQAKPDEMADPTGLIANSGIELLTFGTPNGVKASILLEELKEAYGKDYTVQTIHIGKNIQKQPWFTAINPNGRIPAIVDHDRNGFAVFEGLPILTYLVRHYDPEHRFSFPIDSDDYSVAEQWISWQHGGLGPMQGQANHFVRAAAEKIPYPIQRYVGETERLYGVLDARLADRDWVAGPGRGKYSIADISLVGWVNAAVYGGLDLAGQFPNVRAWLDRVLARPAVQRGFLVPGGEPWRISVASLESALEGKEGLEDLRKTVEESRRLVAEAKEQYGYKYASP